nr:hypothetical protein [uncultured Treponema sp.]
MKNDLNLHDSQILKIITNPITETMQIILSYYPGKIMEIRIKGIQKINQNNIDSLSLFYDSAGGIDSGFIEENENSKILYLSGIINDGSEKYETINWSFSVIADEINFINHSISENREDYLYDQEFLDFDYSLESN